jgi:AcrR family transcriptional regulator
MILTCHILCHMLHTMSVERSSGNQAEDARRNFFLDTATVIFAKRGFEAPTMDELALACGCERRTLYRYFAAKEDIFWAAAARAYGALVADFERVARVWESGKLGAKARILSWGIAYLEFSVAHPEAFRLVMAARERTVSAAGPGAGGSGGGTPSLAKIAESGRMGDKAAELASLDRATLAIISGMAPLLEAEGLCATGEGGTKLWELLHVLIAIVELRARYEGGGASYPFGTEAGIRGMIERQVDMALAAKEKDE